MQKNTYSFPKDEYKNINRTKLFHSVLATGCCFHLFLIIFVYYFFPESNLKVEDVIGMFGVLVLSIALDFDFIKSLCLVDSRYVFFLRMFLLISILQGVVNFLGSWDSPWRYISAALGFMYCFIFSFYTLSVYDRLMRS